MICNITEQAPINFEGPTELRDLLEAHLKEDVVKAYAGYLKNEPKLFNALNTYFSDPENHENVTPLFIYNEETNELVTLMANNKQSPDETGEPGSILAHVRDSGYTDSFMCSDCYGQLSCSSCAIEVLGGTLKTRPHVKKNLICWTLTKGNPPLKKHGWDARPLLVLPHW